MFECSLIFGEMNLFNEFVFKKKKFFIEIHSK